MTYRNRANVNPVDFSGGLFASILPCQGYVRLEGARLERADAALVARDGEVPPQARLQLRSKHFSKTAGVIGRLG
jgi:hypothetical protein